jgi:hypothetical protein
MRSWRYIAIAPCEKSGVVDLETKKTAVFSAFSSYLAVHLIANFTFTAKETSRKAETSPKTKDFLGRREDQGIWSVS